ncbi:hypothetical protein Aargi30884_17160 [Amedibacterium intestinale]|uniref:PcfB family protein n=1 Tax=Amedibacterium intestinale TaxID=2583452 RepID=A0A6N4TJ46_9FIRM|nr:PcfB family protein [Amedibacterium intestinale]BBK22813.1 hypothetical protein Aargi30884_17160 [Amedibacterium intestinale]
MNTGGEAADQIIRISLNGMEVAAKITGKAALEIANMLYAVMKDQKKTKGKTRLENLISTGKPLSVFTLKSGDLASFQKEAKKYGILYYAVRNQRSHFDGMVDIMVKTEDSSRINRIVERFKLSDVSQTAQVKTDIEKTRAAKKQKTEQEIVRPSKSPQTIQKEEELSSLQKEENSTNPKVAKTTKSRPSEPIFNPVVEGTNDKQEKPSVRAELKQIKKELEKETTFKNKDDVKVNKKQLSSKHQQPKTKKKKTKER